MWFIGYSSLSIFLSDKGRFIIIVYFNVFWMWSKVFYFIKVVENVLERLFYVDLKYFRFLYKNEIKDFLFVLDYF